MLRNILTSDRKNAASWAADETQRRQINISAAFRGPLIRLFGLILNSVSSAARCILVLITLASEIEFTY